MTVGTALADSTDDLTPEWFTAALREGGALGPDGKVASVDANLFGTGQFGLVARADSATTVRHPAHRNR